MISESIASNATRYLCAAAYRDRNFASGALQDLHRQEHRSVATPYGVDTGLVLRHCLASQRRRLARDTVLTGLWVLLGAGVAVFGLGGPQLLLEALLVGWGVVFTFVCLQEFEVLARLTQGRFDPSQAPSVSRRQWDRIEALRRSQSGNVTVYSGFMPFVGFGNDVDGWSFTVNIAKGKEDAIGHPKRPRPFVVDELYDKVGGAIRSLRIERLWADSRLFINGKDARDIGWVLPDESGRPLTHAAPATVARYMRQPTQQVRHYLAIQVLEWQGELMVSIFVRFAIVGANLFCEGRYLLLPPVKEAYRKIDELHPRPHLRSFGALLAKSVAYSVLLVPFAPLLLLIGLLRPLATWHARRRDAQEVRTDPTFDFGTTASIREKAMSKNYQHYFQKLDKEMYLKFVQQQLLDSIVTFLDERNIDTSDLKERQTAIFNSGVMMSGGSISAENISVGFGAKAWSGGDMRARMASAGAAFSNGGGERRS